MKPKLRDRRGYERWARRLPIFDNLAAEEDLWPVANASARRRAVALLNRFHSKFPTISFDLAWDTRLINAQAFFTPSGRAVRLYGGLGRHKQIGVEGLAFAIAHEVGHHLGGAPRHPHYTTMSSEARANEWAERDGLPAVLGPDTAQRFVARGLKQLTGVLGLYNNVQFGETHYGYAI